MVAEFDRLARRRTVEDPIDLALVKISSHLADFLSATAHPTSGNGT
jgi:hypothetical protein